MCLSIFALHILIWWCLTHAYMNTQAHFPCYWLSMGSVNIFCPNIPRGVMQIWDMSLILWYFFRLPLLLQNTSYQSWLLRLDDGLYILYLAYVWHGCFSASTVSYMEKTILFYVFLIPVWFFIWVFHIHVWLLFVGDWMPSYAFIWHFCIILNVLQ
jgi:hypothetical protein